MSKRRQTEFNDLEILALMQEVADAGHKPTIESCRAIGMRCARGRFLALRKSFLLSESLVLPPPQPKDHETRKTGRKLQSRKFPRPVPDPPKEIEPEEEQWYESRDWWTPETTLTAIAADVLAAERRVRRTLGGRDPEGCLSHHRRKQRPVCIMRGENGRNTMRPTGHHKANQRSWRRMKRREIAEQVKVREAS